MKKNFKWWQVALWPITIPVDLVIIFLVVLPIRGFEALRGKKRD